MLRPKLTTTELNDCHDAETKVFNALEKQFGQMPRTVWEIRGPAHTMVLKMLCLAVKNGLIIVQYMQGGGFEIFPACQQTRIDFAMQSVDDYLQEFPHPG